MCHHALSFGCSAVNDLSFATTLVRACGRHSVLPRDGCSHRHSSTGSRKHWIRFLEADPQGH